MNGRKGDRFPIINIHYTDDETIKCRHVEGFRCLGGYLYPKWSSQWAIDTEKSRTWLCLDLYTLQTQDTCHCAYCNSCLSSWNQLPGNGCVWITCSLGLPSVAIWPFLFADSFSSVLGDESLRAPTSLSTEMPCFQRKQACFKRTWESGWSLEKHQNLKTNYTEEPPTCPGGFVCNYGGALSGNDFHAMFKINILVSCTGTTSNSFPLLPSSSLLSLNSLPHLNCSQVQSIPTLTSGEKLSLNKRPNSLLGFMHTSRCFHKYIDPVNSHKNSMRCHYFYSLDVETRTQRDLNCPISHGKSRVSKKLFHSKFPFSALP